MKNPLFEPLQGKACRWFSPTQNPFVLTEEFTAGCEDIVFDAHSAGNECTVDTQHKSDLGFWLMANGVMRRIKELNIS